MKNIAKAILRKPIDRLVSKRLREQHFYPTTYIKENDIIIAGFPKSGNTWMQNLISGVLYGIDSTLLPDRLTQELVPEITKGYYKRILNFVCFKSHDLPKPEYRKIIHLVRDGRDAMASYYHFRKGLGYNETYKQHIIEGQNVYPCKWHLYNEKWIENPYNSDIITIRYEDLLKNPLIEMQRICKFIGVERQNELILRSIEGNSFKNMQKKEETFKKHSNIWPDDKKFFRKGKIGSYKEEIPKELVKYFENESHLILSHFGYSNSGSKT